MHARAAFTNHAAAALHIPFKTVPIVDTYCCATNALVIADVLQGVRTCVFFPSSTSLRRRNDMLLPR
jgi:hypothetical protein